MMENLSGVAFLGNYPPRRCGIATFTHDLRAAVATRFPESNSTVLAVTDPGNSYDYPPEVRFEIPEPEIQSYLRAADFLNLSRSDVLCVQHEFGIYGGPAGSHVIGLLRRARMPTVTTLHTILEHPDADQRAAFTSLIECSTRLVCMSERGRKILHSIYQVPDAKIAVIPHGIPDVPFGDPNFYKDLFDVAGRPVLLTFGLLSPGKGVEYAIDALPAIIARHPEVVYIILGATHPNLLKEQGESYRLALESRARKLGVENNVMLVNRYVTHHELCEYIGAADIYLTPYLNESQVTSGTLAYCFGAGKAVVSTPYWHAAELLDEGRGVLVPFRDAGAIASAVNHLLDDENHRHVMRKQAYLLGREMIWHRVAEAYERVFAEARDAAALTPRAARPAATLAHGPADLPPWRLDHLGRMTDSTGVFQHAVYSLPWFEHGYCTDDNARSLLVTVQLEELNEHTPESARIQSAAAAFIHHAWNAQTARFRNFMDFQRRWLEESGSEDSHGRALWALGAVVGRTRQRNLRAWAAALFEQALPVTENFTSPRAWAFAILGLHEYLRKLDGDLLVHRLRLSLAQRLVDLYQLQSTPDWPWYEPILTYDNARLPHALILTGRWTGRQPMLDLGLKTLQWLVRQQTGSDDCFRPIGSNGFWPRGGEKATYDQQPVEATATIGACIEAHATTGDKCWLHQANRAFEWFLGRNDLNLPLYDAANGGTYDGLHPNRVNLNQGAESTLSFLNALAEMKMLYSRMAALKY
jgi:glycosyltransferase involved in cell wall biosynthesis